MNAVSRKRTILAVDDDQKTRNLLKLYLEKHQYVVQLAHDGASFRAEFERFRDDLVLVILDVMLPDTDGFALCRMVRDRSEVPIIMLTASSDDTERIVGLELGADDYLPKPFEPRELLARIRAVLRRRTEGAQPATKVLRFGTLEIDRDARTVTVGGKAAELTSYQFDLLITLAERAGRVLTRDQIMEAVRGRELEAFDRSIDVHMGRIRAAIEADPKNPKRILTVRGVGYVFAKQQD